MAQPNAKKSDTQQALEDEIRNEFPDYFDRPYRENLADDLLIEQRAEAMLSRQEELNAEIDAEIAADMHKLLENLGPEISEAEAREQIWNQSQADPERHFRALFDDWFKANWRRASFRVVAKRDGSK